MKKHKVEIPKGYTLVNETKTKIDGFMTITLGLEPIPTESPMKKELPETWEELGQVNGYAIQCDSDIDKMGYRSTPTNKHIWPTKELAEAALALSQLMQLRDVYNDGWEPNWNYSTKKYVIYQCNTIFAVTTSNLQAHVMAFQTEELRDRFYQYFKDLLETAKPLL